MQAKKSKPVPVEVDFEWPSKKKAPGRYDCNYSDDDDDFIEESKKAPIARKIFDERPQSDANKITNIQAAIDTIRKLPSFNSYID